MNKKEKFIVIDGNSLVYRAFFAIPLLTTSQGLFTNAVYGFTNMLLKLIENEQPDYLAVAFDKGRPAFRLATFPEYKGHRPKSPDELRPQFGLVKQVLEAMKIPAIEFEGYEADDLIGTMVKQAENRQLESVIVTGDRDAYQLISPLTKVLITRKGITETELVDETELLNKYGLTPEQIIDMKGLMGDNSDNIPGIPGVGEKTAIKLLQQFPTIEELYEHTEEVKGKLKDKLVENREQALMSKDLATIVCDAPLEVNWSDLKICPADDEQLLNLFKALEFKALIKKVAERMATTGETGSDANREASRAESTAASLLGDKQIEELADLAAGQQVALWLIGDNPHWQKSGVVGGVVSLKPGEQYYFQLNGEAPAWLKTLLEREDIKKLCHDGKQLTWLSWQLGIKLQGLNFDTMVAAYLCNPARPSQDFAEVCLEYLDVVLPPQENPEEWCIWTDQLWRLKEKLGQILTEQSMEQLFSQVEMPLVSVLTEMELTGVLVDGAILKDMSAKLEAGINQLTAEIFALAGEEFNINSPKQLGVILFEKLQLPVIKKTKTGYSTDAKVLDELAEQHEIVEKILEYRQLVKLKSTYVDGLAAIINPQTGRIHTTFNQTVTATGRLSSTEPNLQNIPIRLEEGRKIRKVFIASNADNVLVAADYSQIELRILAHMSGDENLQTAFQQNQDIHTRTAAEVFGVEMDQVTREMRGRAKAVNFGIVYGISDYGLSQDIKVSRKEAKQYIDSYFARYPGVKSYIDEVIKQARETGFVTTILNRRRYLPDILSSNFNIRSFGERTAMNTPIQGSAADIIKLAMIEVNQELKRRALKTRMLLQVHDELIFDVPRSELEEVIELVKTSMQEAITLNVPLIVDVKVGPNWYDVKEI